MANFFQNLWITINPFERLTRGFEYFYFGFATLVVIVFEALARKPVFMDVKIHIHCIMYDSYELSYVG